MKILVTGGSGYIGSILVPELVKLKFQVTVLDNFMYKQSSLNHLCAFENFKIIIITFNFIRNNKVFNNT